MGKYPKTLVKSNDPSSKAHMVVFTSDEEDAAKKLGFGGPYKQREYPVMLYKGKVQTASKEQGPATLRKVNSPGEEEEAAKEGFKRAGAAKAKK